MDRKRIAVDVICQHSKDGSLIPMRVRVKDTEGEYQIYNIKEYKDLSHQGTKLMPDGVFVTNNTFVYECKIIVFGVKKLIRLYYELNNTIWHMTY
ncbi:hypothetical protein [Acetitomaculum ruminis]|nr:hypothetical protein [Acetitomaculum ruminis]